MDQNTSPTPVERQTLLEWKAPRVSPRQRSRKWYLIASTILAAGIVYGIFSGGWTFSVVLLLCGLMYVLLHNHVPENKSISITNEGVHFEHDFVRYEDCTGYWIIGTEQYHLLHIGHKNRRKADIVIQLGTVTEEQVKNALGQYLEEQKDKREGFVDLLIRTFKL
jgi:hypothetical protein